MKLDFSQGSNRFCEPESTFVRALQVQYNSTLLSYKVRTRWRELAPPRPERPRTRRGITQPSLRHLAECCACGGICEIVNKERFIRQFTFSVFHTDSSNSAGNRNYRASSFSPVNYFRFDQKTRGNKSALLNQGIHIVL